jgi:hypothetical protein
VKPSTVPEVNDLRRCDLKAREFWIREVRGETSIVAASIQGGCGFECGGLWFENGALTNMWSLNFDAVKAS